MNMKIVIVCGFILALAQYTTAAQICGYDVDYSTVFVPACTGNDVLINWPYYQDFTKYYSCNGFNNPTLQNCPNGKYFSYFLQQCTDCNRFVPAPDCQYLKTNGQPQCIASGATTKTPPTTKSTAVPTKPTTTITESPITTKSTTTKKPIITVPTPGTEAPTPGPGVPTPPVLSTAAPGVPTPPVEPPTPPTVEITPPSVD